MKLVAIGLRDGDMALIRSTAIFSGLSPDTLDQLISDASVQQHDGRAGAGDLVAQRTRPDIQKRQSPYLFG